MNWKFLSSCMLIFTTGVECNKYIWKFHSLCYWTEKFLSSCTLKSIWIFSVYAIELKIFSVHVRCYLQQVLSVKNHFENFTIYVKNWHYKLRIYQFITTKYTPINWELHTLLQYLDLTPTKEIIIRWPNNYLAP